MKEKLSIPLDSTWGTEIGGIKTKESAVNAVHTGTDEGQVFV